MASKRDRIRMYIALTAIVYGGWYLYKHPYFHSEESWARWEFYIEAFAFYVIPGAALIELVQWLWGKLKCKKNESK